MFPKEHTQGVGPAGECGTTEILSRRSNVRIATRDRMHTLLHTHAHAPTRGALESLQPPPASRSCEPRCGEPLPRLHRNLLAGGRRGRRGRRGTRCLGSARGRRASGVLCGVSGPAKLGSGFARQFLVEPSNTLKLVPRLVGVATACRINAEVVPT